MSDDKSSLDENVGGGRGGIPGGGGEQPSQGHLFYSTEITWAVVEKEEKQIWNEGLQIFDFFPTYVHTRPLNWSGPVQSEKLPWEE